MNIELMNMIIDLSTTPITREKRLEAYKTFATSEWGQIVLADIIDTYNPLAQTHVAGDPYATAFNCGQLDPVLHILQHIVLASRQQAPESTTYTKP